MNVSGSTSDVDSDVKVIINDFIVKILQGIQEINADDIEIFLDNNEFDIDEFDENGKFEINQDIIANIKYNFQLISESTMSVNVQPSLTIINGIIDELSLVANPDGNNQFDVKLS